jgi:hypothetical protein
LLRRRRVGRAGPDQPRTGARGSGAAAVTDLLGQAGDGTSRSRRPGDSSTFLVEIVKKGF